MLRFSQTGALALQDILSFLFLLVLFAFFLLFGGTKSS